MNFYKKGGDARWLNLIAVAAKVLTKEAVKAEAAVKVAAGRARLETFLVVGEIMPLPKARVSDSIVQHSI